MEKGQGKCGQERSSTRGEGSKKAPFSGPRVLVRMCIAGEEAKPSPAAAYRNIRSQAWAMATLITM